MAKRKKEEEGGGGAPEWMGTYGDMVTLLMAFFVMLFAMSSIDAAKFMEFAQAMNPNVELSLLSGTDTLSGALGNGIIEFPAPPSELTPQNAEINEYEPGSAVMDLETLEALKAAAARDELDSIAEDLRTYFAESVATSNLEVEVSDQYVVIELAGSVSFDSASHSIKPEALEILKVVAEVLRGYPNNDIVIEGHTDSDPINRPPIYPDNVMLSLWRAREILNYFVYEEGLDRYRISPRGFGEMYPKADNSTPEGKALNRRVEIKIYSELFSNNLH